MCLNFPLILSACGGISDKIISMSEIPLLSKNAFRSHFALSNESLLFSVSLQQNIIRLTHKRKINAVRQPDFFSYALSAGKLPECSVILFVIFSVVEVESTPLIGSAAALTRPLSSSLKLLPLRA